VLVLQKLSMLEDIQVSNISVGVGGQAMFDLLLQFQPGVLQ
jgi:hypothetical protein